MLVYNNNKKNGGSKHCFIIKKKNMEKLVCAEM